MKTLTEKSAIHANRNNKRLYVFYVHSFWINGVDNHSVRLPVRVDFDCVARSNITGEIEQFPLDVAHCLSLLLQLFLDAGQDLRLKLSQAELGERCHMDRSCIWRIEKGVHAPTLTTSQILANALGIDLKEMLVTPAKFKASLGE